MLNKTNIEGLRDCFRLKDCKTTIKCKHRAWAWIGSCMEEGVESAEKDYNGSTSKSEYWIICQIKEPIKPIPEFDNYTVIM